MQPVRSYSVTLTATLALALAPAVARADDADDRAGLDRGRASVRCMEALTEVGLARLRGEDVPLPPCVAVAPGGPEDPVEPDPEEPVPAETLEVYPLRSPEGVPGMWRNAAAEAVNRARMKECDAIESIARETPPPTCPDCGEGLDAWALAGGTGAAVGFAVAFVLFGLR